MTSHLGDHGMGSYPSQEASQRMDTGKQSCFGRSESSPWQKELEGRVKVSLTSLRPSTQVHVSVFSLMLWIHNSVQNILIEYLLCTCARIWICFHYSDMDAVLQTQGFWGAWKPYLVMYGFNKCVIWMGKILEKAKPHKSLLFTIN